MSTPAESQSRERAPNPERLRLTLFVSGASHASTQTVRRLRALCDRHCPSGYDLEVFDIHQQSEAAIARGVLAVPTLIRELPLPVRVLIGDFTDEPRVIATLGLPEAQDD